MVQRSQLCSDAWTKAGLQFKSTPRQQHTYSTKGGQDEGSASVSDSTEGVQFLPKGTVWNAKARRSRVQVSSGLCGSRWFWIGLAQTCYFCCCLRLSSRICLWAGSRTPASSRSSSVMSLEKEANARMTFMDEDFGTNRQTELIKSTQLFLCNVSTITV